MFYGVTRGTTSLRLPFGTDNFPVDRKCFFKGLSLVEIIMCICFSPMYRDT